MPSKISNEIWNTSATEAVCNTERSPCSTEKENNLAIKDQFDKESLQNILEKRFVPIVIQEAASSMRLVWFWLFSYAERRNKAEFPRSSRLVFRLKGGILYYSWSILRLNDCRLFALISSMNSLTKLVDHHLKFWKPSSSFGTTVVFFVFFLFLFFLFCF